jgi:GTP-binding protein
VNFFQTGDLGIFVDLPGYGFARAPERVRHQWKALVDAYLEGDRPVAVCLLLVDSRHDPTHQDVQLCSWLKHAGLPYRVVLTKADAVGSSRIERVVRHAGEVLGLATGEERPLPVSARTGKGIDQVRSLIHHAVNS